ncbi:nuclear pore complex protein NUP160-like isoform X2 [Phragmites australis]|uniref:nuclear pore complex protein NUP160-like isoform X2 n=1 Tax=Phragmites australis TaxID=29695 RepID=UPI002D799B5A|nr:nuclear pore complex protein NUP160-like isoform X2 [Phragmites australis]
MAAPDARRIVGAEVPIPGSDKLRWIDLTVPSVAPESPSNPFVCVPQRAASGSHIIPFGDSQYYLTWRLHEEHQNVLEVIELCASKEFPNSALRLVFQEALCPFAYLCKREGGRQGELVYLLYVLTVSGVALLCHLRSPFSYVSGSILHQDDIVEFNLQTHAQSAKVTAVIVKPGCLVIGRQDGSICCYSLGKLAPNSPGFSNELRDDAGIGRLWTLMSRTKAVGPVQDIVATVVNERNILFVLHLDGNLRIWDISSHTKLLNYNVHLNDVEGHPSRLWVGEADDDQELISLAVLHQGTVVQDCEHVALYGFSFSAGEKFLFSPEPSISTIPLLEGKLVDLKIGTGKLWILKEFGSMLYEILQYDFDTEKICSYVLQEDAISEQLFQSSDDALDDLVWTADSMFYSIKEQAFNFISSMFLRRLLQPGVNHCSALREILLEHKRFMSDSEFQSLTANGLRKEILSIIEQEGRSQTASATAYHWKKFSARYLHSWCWNNRPYGLLLDTNRDVFGLIRKGSFSMFRCLESAELLIYGSSDELRNFDGLEMSLLDDISDFELLDEVLRCMGHIHHLLGRSSTAIYYESLISSVISSDEIASQIIKMLETGFSPQPSSSLITLLGTDAYVERRQAAHKSQRKFSVEMLLSLHKLQSRSTSWSTVFDVIEKFMKCLNTNITIQKYETKRVCNVNSVLLVQATSQVARTMFECAFDLFLFLSYLVGVGGQVSLLQSDVARIKLKLFPMIQDILGQWIVLHFVGISPTTPPTIDDFSYQLSSLQLGKADELSLHRKLGCSDFTLACLLDFPKSPEGDVLSTCFPSPAEVINLVRRFSHSIMCGSNVERVQTFSGSTINLSAVLVRHGQYEAAQSLLGILETYLNHEKLSQAGQDADIAYSAYLHLNGFCLLMLAHDEANIILRESKVHDAIRCFFRAASGHEAPKALQKFSLETGFQVSGECRSISLWRLHYYEWAMQIFEQHSMSEGACQFALAALEQTDIIVDLDNGNEAEGLPETATMIKGRLWANVFKYSLDLKHFRDAYCAIDSNPDDDSKYVCLRRFIIVLCELGETKVLCDGKIPFTDLVEKVEQELFWKAERSDLSSRPNLYKVLYSFEAYRNNWRKAAAYMYRYFVRLNREGNAGGSRQLPHVLQERLHALSATINALQLVDPSFAWLDSACEADDQISPTAFGTDSELSRLRFCVDIEILEKEYILTEAQYMLSTVKSRINFSESQSIEALMDILINENLYDLAFTIVLKFWKESGMKRELERVFSAIAQQCCPNGAGKSERNLTDSQQLLLLPSEEDAWDVNTKNIAVAHQLQGSCHWETLELYLEKYKDLHPRLPVIVAETLLYTDPEIEIPLWLVQMFKTNKAGNMMISRGMSGKEADPAALFRLYINYGRHAEATNLLVEYLESFASSRPVDVLHRKKMSAAWYPYTAIERLLCQLEEIQIAGHSVDQCDRLKKLLHGALMSHLQQVVVDSEDVLSSIGGGQGMESRSS